MSRVEHRSAPDAPTVVVEPPEAHASRARLLSALGEALGVRILPAGGRTSAAASAAIVFGDRRPTGGLPAIVLPAEAPQFRPQSVEVGFAADSRIDRSLRSASLSHRAATLVALADLADGEVLAHVGRTPVWVRQGDVERVAVGIADLDESELLRNRVSCGGFLPLVPIVDFLRRSAPDSFAPPEQRAAFVFDDPNLHALSYGYLDYNRLAADARRVGYHVAFATIPLDTWHASRAAVRLFRSHRDVLSLLVHGNDHLRHELGRSRDSGQSRALLAQARRRIERFERRYGVPVARVMAPPHGACSEAVADAMPLFFDALCITRPYPWLDAPPPGRVLAGWGPTEIVASGIPVIPRLRLDTPHDEIVLRAFLRHPIIVYGHHGDVRGGLDVLAEVAEAVRKVGDVRWMSLDGIVRTSYDSRVHGSRLSLRLHTRRATVPIPHGVTELAVDSRSLSHLDLIVVGGKPQGPGPVPVPGGATVDVSLERRDPSDLADGASRRPHAWPYVRRGLVEARDRALPLVART